MLRMPPFSTILRNPSFAVVLLPLATKPPSTTSSAIPESASSMPERERLVSFDKVEIHSFYPRLGENSGGEGGPPIALGEAVKEEPCRLSVSQYEQERSKRPDDELYLSPESRKQILIEGGYSLDDINEATSIAAESREEQRVAQGLVYEMLSRR